MLRERMLGIKEAGRVSVGGSCRRKRLGVARGGRAAWVEHPAGEHCWPKARMWLRWRTRRRFGDGWTGTRQSSYRGWHTSQHWTTYGGTRSSQARLGSPPDKKPAPVLDLGFGRYAPYAQVQDRHSRGCS